MNWNPGRKSNNIKADSSPIGLAQSRGATINYYYDPSAILKNHELHANRQEVAASQAVKALAGITARPVKKDSPLKEESAHA